MKVKVSYHWHLRQLMAARGMFATSALVPLLASRGVVLSREQVYRLVARVPERLSLTTLAALCDILEVSPAELIEPVRETRKAKTTATKASRSTEAVSDLRPRRARVGTGAKR
ncbi:MAG: helix-turn-helix transcriptional regulator [Actinomycetota bacterium]|nr:helix-turn-helix transcriptional regulator [Actinomycetota bacterium]